MKFKEWISLEIKSNQTCHLLFLCWFCWDWISLKCSGITAHTGVGLQPKPLCGCSFKKLCFWEGPNSTPSCNKTVQAEAAPLWMQENIKYCSRHWEGKTCKSPSSTAFSSFFCPNTWLLSHSRILRRLFWLINHPDWLLNTSFLFSLPSSFFVSFPLNLNHKVLSRPQFPSRFIDVSSMYPSIVLQLVESPEYTYTKYF